MNKRQMASEPSMEEILSSIRKMISDDKPGPNPLPDMMGRTPFGESISRSSAPAEVNGGTHGETGIEARTGAASGSSFNSLADALKVATALSDQRRSLQQEIANVIEKGPRNNLEALTEMSATRAVVADGNIAALGGGAAQSAAIAAVSGEPAQSASEAKDLLSFDFGTMVPRREDAQPKPPTGDAKRNASAPTGVAAPAAEASAAKAEGKSEQPAEPRVFPLRSGLNGSANHGFNGSGLNVAAFPRPVREVGKIAEPEPAPVPSEPAKFDELPEAQEQAAGEVQPASVEETLQSVALSKHGEALLDAVVDLVQQQPGAMSVFASGDSFIYGSGGKKSAKPAEIVPVVTEVRNAEVVVEAAGAPKMDRAAAELLRPMLRQWLAENMERILEDALRSELTAQVQPDKDPNKS
ncbi:MAG: hypothetical protein WDN31_15705 [Hyphomicrobium sp.]